MRLLGCLGKPLASRRTRTTRWWPVREYPSAVDRAHVVAEQKLRLVRAHQARGQVVHTVLSQWFAVPTDQSVRLLPGVGERMAARRPPAGDDGRVVGVVVQADEAEIGQSTQTGPPGDGW